MNAMAIKVSGLAKAYIESGGSSGSSQSSDTDIMPFQHNIARRHPVLLNGRNERFCWIRARLDHVDRPARRFVDMRALKCRGAISVSLALTPSANRAGSAKASSLETFCFAPNCKTAIIPAIIDVRQLVGQNHNQHRLSYNSALAFQTVPGIPLNTLKFSASEYYFFATNFIGETKC